MASILHIIFIYRLKNWGKGHRTVSDVLVMQVQYLQFMSNAFSLLNSRDYY